MKFHLRILENVHIKVGDFCMLDDFIILDIAEDAYTQLILGRPFLATSDCQVDVKKQDINI